MSTDQKAIDQIGLQIGFGRAANDQQLIDVGDDNVLPAATGAAQHAMARLHALDDPLVPRRRSEPDPVPRGNHMPLIGAERLEQSAGSAFELLAIRVFDNARRFDVAVRVVSVGGDEDTIRLHLTLKPIAGFKGETSEDGDPDSAPRPVDLTLSNDSRLLPLSLQVSIAYLPISLRLDHVCASLASCGPER